MVEVKWRVPLVRFRGCSLFSLVGNGWMVNLKSGGALRWKAEDRRLEKAGRAMWQASTSKVVAPASVG
jgi:hypothetical protein